MKKIERGTQFVMNNLHMFQCPTCHEPFEVVEGHSLVCENNHSIDVNKKGSLNVLNHAVNTEYDDDMLTDRRQVLQDGLFDGIVDAVAEALPQTAQSILDVGTGEGTPFAKLLNQRPYSDVGIGFDISKAGVNLATQLDTDALFMVADLAHLPFNTGVFDAVVEFFSPSAYEEFKRVVKPGGSIVKVVPAAGYLRELREMLYPVGSSKHTYDNQQVVDRFYEYYPDAEMVPVTYTWQIPADDYQSLLHMTPLHWGARPEAQAAAEAQPLTAITVDVVVLIATQK